jgi:hypothetical protein
MAFTQSDRDIIIATKTRVDGLVDRLDNLPCEQHPPECTQETRLESLEKTRGRAIGASIKGLIAIILSVGAYCVSRLIGG